MDASNPITRVTSTNSTSSSDDDYHALFAQTFLEQHIESVLDEMLMAHNDIVNCAREWTELRSEHKFRLRKYAHNKLFLKKYNRDYYSKHYPEAARDLVAAIGEYKELRKRLVNLQEYLMEVKTSRCMA